MTELEKNKAIVKRFNLEVIQDCNLNSFNELMDKAFINQTAPKNANGADSMWNTFNHILKPAFPDLKVEIYEQIAEGDKVTTRKAITGTHEGILMGIQATHKKVKIDVIDIVRLHDGKYVEHWGINTLLAVLQELRA